MFACAALDTLKYHSIGWTDFEQAGRKVKLLARLSFQFTPQFIRAYQEWNVAWVFKVGLSDNPGIAVGATPPMGWIELIDAYHAATF
jgi:hypothetical protein